jgi:cytochrome c-type biogenesis protein CcmH/NrfF
VRLRLRLALLLVAISLAASSALAQSPDKPGEADQAPVNAARIRERTPSSPVAASQAAASQAGSWSRELERELMSPYCPGRSLIECPSPDATELRLWIQGQEAAGVSRAKVEQRLFQEFGDQLRQSPRAEGWGLFAYLVPAGVLLAGGAFAFGFLRRQSRPVSASAVPVEVDPELVREIDRELGAS